MPLAAALLLTLAFQTKVTPEVTAARKLAKDAEAYATKNQSRKRMYMLQGKAWLAMRTDGDHLKDEIWREDVSTVAFTWERVSGQILIVSVTAGSPSGDWSSNKISTYRPNGTLAHSSYRFAAFMFGGLVLEEESVFNPTGKRVFNQLKLTDLNSKPRKSKEERSQMLSSRPAIKDYLKAGQLPFLGAK